jgi:hypothetical protein
MGVIPERMNNDLAVRTRTCRRKPSEYDSRPAERVEIGVASGSLQDIREFRGKPFLLNGLQVVSRMT